jgi:hypothetical protein
MLWHRSLDCFHIECLVALISGISSNEFIARIVYTARHCQSQKRRQIFKILVSEKEILPNIKHEFERCMLIAHQVQILKEITTGK